MSRFAKRREKFFRFISNDSNTKREPFDRIDIVLQYLFNFEDVWYAKEYGEPGYANKATTGILFGNWNGVPKPICDMLDEAGYELEWSDEWQEHDGKAYRTTADSYFWEPTLIYDEYGDTLVVGEDDEAIIELRAMTDKSHTPQCVPGRITEEVLAEFGYVKEPDEVYESGWHPGQTDDPVKLAAELWKQDDVEAVVFRIAEQSQFYIKFESYVKRIEVEA